MPTYKYALLLRITVAASETVITAGVVMHVVHVVAGIAVSSGVLGVLSMPTMLT
jgi:hypothetical protein